MLILAIETSCDDTGIAVLEVSDKKHPRFRVLSNIVSSQVKLHAKYGGVYPALAKREHQRNLVPVLKEALNEANQLIPNLSSRHPERSPKGEVEGSHTAHQGYEIPRQARDDKKVLKSILEREPELLKKIKNFLQRYQKPDIDLIAVTYGPGLEPALWVGVNFARALAYAWNLPVVPVNHIEAHILANWLSTISEYPSDQTCHSERRSDLGRAVVEESHTIKFPVIALVVSGGHTQLLLMNDFGHYKIIGETRDDAAGECFDKTARILGLGYPGGPAIAAEAAKFKIHPVIRPGAPSNDGAKFKIELPRPMINHKNYDFSFSGLKTAVLYEYKKQTLKTRKNPKYLQAMAYEIQQAVIDVLIAKTLKASRDFKAKSIILGGGVAANKELRQQLKQRIKTEIPDSPASPRSSRSAGRAGRAKFYIPDSNLCTDNATMVAVAGYYGWLRGKTKHWKNIEAEANLRV